MQLRDTKLFFSPSDLTNFIESKFVSYMDRLLVEKDPRAIKDPPDEGMKIMRERGIQHEKAYLDLLKRSNGDVCEIPEKAEDGIELTLQAIRDGRQFIYQAHLLRDQFFGRCDFLVRVDGRPSELLKSNYSYEPYDTKLSFKPKPYFAIQLCAYAEMLEAVQGILPEKFVIVLGDGTPKALRTEDFIYFYRQLKSQFLEFHDKFDGSKYPEDIELPAFCEWKTLGKSILEDRDDLCRVANIRKSQIVKLKKASIERLTELATTSASSIERLSSETFANLRQQADLQLRSQGLDKPLFELMPAKADAPRRGLALLPAASSNDVFFDMEGYPHVEGGLEYLFGAGYLEAGNLKFFERWAHDQKQEQIAFEEFVDWVFARFEADPTMHVYHYSHYEPNALKRLMGKFGSREYEIDQLLRHEVFVDLYTVVRQSLRVGEPGYSIKNVERLYRDKREGEVSTAMDSVVWYYKWLESKDGNDEKSSKMLSAIRDYNKEDCDSTYELYRWLHDLQKKRGIRYLPPPPPAAARERDDDAAAILARAVAAKHGNGVIPTMLSQLLHFHKREEKPVWWAIFDKRSWTPEELYADLESISGLCATSRWGERLARSNLYEFNFDADQETKIDVEDTVCFYKEDGSFETMTVREIDTDNGRIALSSSKVVPPGQIDIVKKDLTGITTISDSIFELVSAYCGGRELPPAVTQFLERKSPRLRGHQNGQPIIAEPNKSLVPQAVDAIRRMETSTLCIQGPPGSGKTYTGAEAVLALIGDGKRVGVTSNSHKAIEVMLNAIGALALERGIDLHGVKIGMDRKDTKSPTFKHPGIVFQKDVNGVFGAYSLIGGTAYAFSRGDAVGALDYLFVDEAGQVSVANLVGMSRSARNIVLLGDQMQLEQPVRGSHPGDSGLSTLQYYLKDHSAIPADMGIFLGVTRRLPPRLCEFISSAIYEGRLSNLASTAEHNLNNPKPCLITKATGLLFEPVPHAGCVQSSEQEADLIKELITELKRCSITFDGQSSQLVPEEHILIVAPYNKQVRLLKQRLPGLEIGTVDKFQGKQKPVVIISMADSDANESARGMDFLFSKNRLNVAISRAQILAIVVANPLLAYADCHSLKSMSLVNLFSRIVQCGAIEHVPVAVV